VALILLVIFSGLAIVTNMMNGASKTRAAIVQTGNDVTIQTGSYLLKTDGHIYTYQSPFLPAMNDAQLDQRFLSTFYNVDTGFAVDSNTNLTVGSTSGLATLMAEGSVNLNNLTVTNNGTLTQAYADRTGHLNRPTYSSDYWGVVWTGFIKLTGTNLIFPQAAGGKLDDAMAIEVGTDASCSAPATTVDTTYWHTIYSDSLSASWPIYGDNAGNGSPANRYYGLDACTRTLMTGTGSTTYVPVKIYFGEVSGSSQLWLNYIELNPSSPYGVAVAAVAMPLSNFYGSNEDGTVNTSLVRRMDFDYYISAYTEKTIPQYDLNMGSGFSNAVLAGHKRNMNLRQDLRMLDSPVGSNGGTGESYGKWDAYHNDDTFKFEWQGWGQNSTPVADPLGTWDDKGGAIPSYNILGSHYDGGTINWNALDQAYADNYNNNPAGLHLNVANTILIRSGGKIDATGSGYAGAWGVGTQPNYGSTRLRGGSVSFDGAPGGGISMNGGCTAIASAGSHAGEGGAGDSGLNCGGNTWRKPPDWPNNTYGGPADNPSSLGSGGGYTGSWNGGGDGGGLLEINSSVLAIQSSRAIFAEGRWTSSMQQPYDNDSGYAGGAGGSINIRVSTLNVGVGLSGVFSASAQEIPITGNRNLISVPLYNIDGSSGGGGGYIFIQYTNSNLDSSAIRTASRVSGARGSKNGAWSINNSDGDKVYDGQDGRLIVVTGGPQFNIRKKLVPINRQGSGAAFNPYALQLGDVIQVSIEIGDMTGVATVDDELLRIPSDTYRYRCEPSDITGSSSLGFDAYLNGGTFVASADPNSGDFVEWANNGQNPLTSPITYYCQVRTY